ncbi:MAG: hypothetical protein WC915_02135 [archaeon]|jgi:hypothetical protein
MKKIRVILSKNANEAYLELTANSKESKLEKSLLKSINHKIDLIKLNPHLGNPISKDKIPKIYKTQFEITNLFRVELTNFWRMDYTLKSNETEIEIIAFVLNIMSHEKYNKIYEYNKK